MDEPVRDEQRQSSLSPGNTESVGVSVLSCCKHKYRYSRLASVGIYINSINVPIKVLPF